MTSDAEDGTKNGANRCSATDAVDERDASAPPPPPPAVAELAEACLVYVEQATRVQLDYTLETLPLLDHYVRQARSRLGTRDDLLALVAAPLGAYLGEVMRRAVLCTWFAPPGEYRRWRIELTDVFLSLNPIGSVVEALLLQEVDGWGASLRMRPEGEEVARGALANLPDVDVEEYFSPSNRLEVLMIVSDALLAHDVAEGTRCTWSARDYGPVRAEGIGDALVADEGEDAGD